MMKVSNNKRDILIFRTSITTELEIERINILFAQYSQIQCQNGNFEEKEAFLNATTRGIRTFDEIKGLHSFVNREKAITAACTASIMVPFRETEEALLKDPELTKNQLLKTNQDWINQDFVIERIKEVSTKLGVPINNLIASSVSWIKYLALIKL